MMRDPSKVPQKIKDELKGVGLWDVNPRNLFRITWKNEPTQTGGGFGDVNYIEIPPALSGVPCRIFLLVGKYFPTGAHKVGATFGPLVERLTSGHFDPTTQKAMWPSTGNYCRGGAFNSALLHSPCIAVLPAGMSKERFEWLHSIGAEVVATPGCESNVKEIFDMNNKLVREGKGRVVSLNQFEEFGNPLWHYAVTGPAMEEVFLKNAKPGQRFSGVVLNQGSAGTLGSTQYLRKKFPAMKVAASEAWQCPTLLHNGFGDHRIEGIGDKHVPWVLNVKNMDVAVAIDDDKVIRCMHLFNFPAGREYLKSKGISADLVAKLELMGISSIANLMGCIKEAKYFEWNESDCLFAVCTDSMQMYQSRLAEFKGEYTREQAAIDFAECLSALTSDHLIEMTYLEKKRMHNLKYFTWVEQQGKTCEELNSQWFEDGYWDREIGEDKLVKWDAQIMQFNKDTGMAQKYGML
eukprot:TRINITY_DN18033_c0_g1_i1.p2 TRINITY_DN18033_c0_g1~~TRINITY_DN18033_c0_g1_i1.p2  ORF type:complete len:504 (+),score=188.29 TRINITY_DN18033_c0_g1_i1:121-1512(+)